ncbi:MAG: PaaI family thioesterase [Pseudomonadota bacterium]
MRQFVDYLPHAKALGLSVAHAEPGIVSLTMPYAERLIGDPDSGIIHGGAVSTLLDTCAGGAVVSHPKMNGAITATLDLRIDYMRPAVPQRAVVARAECYQVTRSVAFVRATAWTEGDEDRPIAMATGAFTASRSAEPAIKPVAEG